MAVKKKKKPTTKKKSPAKKTPAKKTPAAKVKRLSVPNPVVLEGIVREVRWKDNDGIEHTNRFPALKTRGKIKTFVLSNKKKTELFFLPFEMDYLQQASFAPSFRGINSLREFGTILAVAWQKVKDKKDVIRSHHFDAGVLLLADKKDKPTRIGITTAARKTLFNERGFTG